MKTVLVRTEVGRKNRTTIQREVRKIPSLNVGDVIEWIFVDGETFIEK